MSLQAQLLTYFHLQILVQEEVAQLEISVNNAVSMQVLAAKDDLTQIVAGLGLGECFPPLVQLQERLGGGGKEEWGVGTQAQGREGVSLGEGSPGPYRPFLLQDNYDVDSPLSQATTVHSTPSPTSSLPSPLPETPLSAHSGSSESPVSLPRASSQQQIPFLTPLLPEATKSGSNYFLTDPTPVRRFGSTAPLT